jgi:hypothetical protein
VTPDKILGPNLYMKDVDTSVGPIGPTKQAQSIAHGPAKTNCLCFLNVCDKFSHKLFMSGTNPSVLYIKNNYLRLY